MLSTREPGEKPIAAVRAHDCRSEAKDDRTEMPRDAKKSSWRLRKTPHAPSKPKIAPEAPTLTGAVPSRRESKLPATPETKYVAARRDVPNHGSADAPRTFSEFMFTNK